MVEADPISTIIFPVLTLVVAIAIPVGLFSMRQFGKTSEGTLTGTIKLEGLKSNVEQVQEAMDKGFTKIENLINRRDEENKQQTQKTWDSINSISTKISLFEYRLKQLERKTGFRSDIDMGGNDNNG